MPDPTVFDAMFRVEFARAMQALFPPKIGRIESFTQMLNSTKRAELQAWMSPVPAATKFTGTRLFKMLDHSIKRVEMLEYDASFKEKNRNLKDAQLALWQGKPAELVNRVNNFRTTEVLDIIAESKSTVDFGGTTYQAANSHSIGTGDNLLASTTSSGTATNIVALYTGAPLKPLIWYDRDRPKLDSDAGTKESSKSKETKWWVDGEGAATYGYWWDFVYNDMSAAPTVAQFKTMLGDFLVAFRSFKLPDSEYVHEQTEFSKQNLMLVIPPHIEPIARQVRDNTMISLTTNEWVNSFDYVLTHKMDD